MKKGVLLSVAIVMLIFGITGVASALNIIDNGDFSSGLTSWASTGVTVEDGQALLDANGSSGVASLSQSFYISPETASLAISFDLTFEGVDNAWLYNDSFDSWIGTFVHWTWWIFEGNDWEYQELLSGDSSDGLRTYNFSTTFAVPGDLADVDPNGIIGFELNENSGLFRDNTNTRLLLDNVVVDDGVDGNGAAPVPEPATMLLLGAGLLGLGGFRKKFRK